ncbi:MAG TPA: rhodanese-like domain-containing protein [Thermoleophilia bacterium]|nr:rhodanese-like domain-containing protein [Thermoleophilia bacterium]
MSKTVAELIAEAKAQVENVSPKVAAAEATSGAAVLLDVREPVEWEHHIAGAVQVPRGLLEFVADPTSPKHKPELDPAGRVIVYCRSGSRAALACATLKTMGFANVANLEGGFGAWQAAGLPASEHHDGI